MTELYDIIEQSYESSSNLGSSLSRAEILGVLADLGVPSFTSNQRFTIRDSQGTAFMVTYVLVTDTFYFERLTEAV